MWTNESPTVEGWYWYIECIGTEISLLSVIQVIDCDGIMLALLYEDTNDVREMKGNWSGPLTPPGYKEQKSSMSAEVINEQQGGDIF